MFVSSFAILRHCSGISGLIGSPSSPLAHRRQLARRRPDDDSSPLLWQLLSGCRINAPALPPCMALPVPGPPQCLLAPTSGRHASRPFVALRTCTRAEVGCGGWQTVQQMQRMRARASHASSSSSMLVRAAATGKYKKKIQRTRGKGGGGHSEGGVYGNGGPTGEAEYYRCAEEERDLPFETIQAIARCIACGGVGVLPTDSSYAFVCDVSNVSALTKMYRLKRVSDPSKSMSVLCRHMADVNAYSTGFPTTQAVNWFRVCKKVLPGPYTFILHASKALPKQCLEFDKKCRIRRHVGVRVSNDEILNQVRDLSIAMRLMVARIGAYL